MSYAVAAKYMGKSKSFVAKWVQRYKKIKNVDDLPERGARIGKVTPNMEKEIVNLFKRNPTLMLKIYEKDINTHNTDMWQELNSFVGHILTKLFCCCNKILVHGATIHFPYGPGTEWHAAGASGGDIYERVDFCETELRIDLKF
ncbi:hypothetical protein EAI_12505 [Harpegnathos saltator]|uniref:Uncharacterized protein n=1 Tax=Harpegnathos saltator TaxID=610380 RepID=E2BEL9_HARSA|nr:hypothetical protein EAI_12505 [Harpegnathos saltator]